MGDIILTTGVAAGLARRYPQARIDYLTRAPYDRLLCEEPILNRVIVLPEKTSGSLGFLRRYLNFLEELRRTRYDLVVDFFSRGPRSRLIARVTGAPYRLGLVDRSFPGSRWINRFVYTRTSTPPIQLALTVDRMVHLLSRIFSLSSLPTGSALPVLTVTEDNLSAAQTLLAQDFSSNVPVVLIFCGSGIPSKNWPAPRFAEIAKRLVERGLGVLFLGASSDHGQMEQVRNSLADSPGIVFREDLPFGTLKGLCRLSRGILGNDSGPLHLAQATGSRVLVLFGPGDHVSYAPFRGRFLKADLACQPCQSFANHCPDNRCMKEIPVEEVWNALTKTFCLPEMPKARKDASRP
ncbi:MAG: glycosyltransferase family 9 protein [Leptospirillia bacterium]